MRKKITPLVGILCSILFFTACSKDNIFEDNNVQKLETAASHELHSEFIAYDGEGFIAPIAPQPMMVKPKNVYDLNLVNNLIAIRDMTFTLQSANGSRFLSSNGNQRACVMSANANSNAQKFYAHASIGESNYANVVIYSQQEQKPIGIGTVGSATNQLGIDGTAIMRSKKFSIVGSQRSSYVVIESQYLGHLVDPNDFFGEIYYDALTASGYNMWFERYLGASSGEWKLTPDATFTLSEVKFINAETAHITQLDDFTVDASYLNESYRVEKWDTERFPGSITETSLFTPHCDINWKLTIPTNSQYKRPGVYRGQVDLNPPVNTEQNYVKYETVIQFIPKTITADPQNSSYDVPARSRLDITYYYSVYEIETDYEASIVNGTRTGKILGRWKGKIYVDEKREAYFEIDYLDTPEIIRGTTSQILSQ